MDFTDQEIDFDDEEVCANMHKESSKEAVSEILSVVPAPETQTSLLDAPSASYSDPTNGYKEPEQIELLHVPEWWEEHWKGMPEFIQKEIHPYHSFYVHFETPADLAAFGKLLKQNINSSTKWIWFPELTVEKTADKRYISEPPDDSPDDVEDIE